MLRILAVGNSFSEDATYYLHQILEIAGVENQVVNLYIGGCSLEKHWRNIEKNAREYQFQFNGTKTDRRVTVKEVLKEAKWDVIVTQQASHDSGWLDTYEPFLGKIVAYFRENAPEARLFLHETWAYEKSSDHESFARYNRDQQEMFDRLQSAYTAMAGKYQLQLIPCGEMIQKLRKTPYFQEEGDRSICRDGFHMHYLYGRYALGCMWAAAIAGVSIKDNAFQPYTEYLPYGEPGAEILKCIRKIVAEMPHSQGWNQERYHYIWHAEYLFLASDRHYLLMDHKKDMVIDNYCLEPDEREASAADFVANRMKKLGQRLKK